MGPKVVATTMSPKEEQNVSNDGYSLFEWLTLALCFLGGLICGCCVLLGAATAIKQSMERKRYERTLMARSEQESGVKSDSRSPAFHSPVGDSNAPKSPISTNIAQGLSPKHSAHEASCQGA